MGTGMRLQLFLLSLGILCTSMYLVFQTLLSRGSQLITVDPVLPIDTPHVVHFQPEEIVDYDDLLPWWEVPRGRACHRLLNEEVLLNLTETPGNCGFQASKAGDNQKVVSYTLFGTSYAFWANLGPILKSVKKNYPGWVVRLHVDPRIYQPLLCPYLKNFDNFFICDVTNLPISGDMSKRNPMMWRALPLLDRQVKYFIVRDLDSRITDREVQAVAEWQNSQTLLHVMRDHPSQDQEVPTASWGIFKPASAHKAITMAATHVFKMPGSTNVNFYYMKALKLYLYPFLKHSTYQHDSFFCDQFEETEPFPTQRANGSYVGNSSYRLGSRKDVMTEECPESCRPGNHKDWQYC